jgi:Uma2 family endonuclease
MVQRLPGGYRVDPADPRAPPQEEWDRMTAEERERVVAALPSEFSLDLMPPEGDLHRKAKSKAVEALDGFFQRIGRKVYLSSELGVFYPGERCFAPDVLAVLDVEPGDRTQWVVSKEGKGLDLVIEVHYAGNNEKDFAVNVERYARLGIGEYFIFDRARLGLRGYRLPSREPGRQGKARTYRRIVPQEGRYVSQVLGLDLMLEGSKLRFFHGTAALPEADELIAKLGSMLDDVIASKEAAEQRAEVEAKRADAAVKRANAAVKRAAALERQLAEAQAELERLKRRR